MNGIAAVISCRSGNVWNRMEGLIMPFTQSDWSFLIRKEVSKNRFL